MVSYVRLANHDSVNTQSNNIQQSKDSSSPTRHTWKDELADQMGTVDKLTL